FATWQDSARLSAVSCFELRRAFEHRASATELGKQSLLREALIYSASGMKCKEPGAQSVAWPFH
ncbi:MAG: hypothetical protein ACRC1I_00020, partial [Pseudomonas proteolytica]|uniref:hypothetical protein n=1 Tax=Pseudomonas proteolytica TaxID=219574 RepID=UPI003F304A91